MATSTASLVRQTLGGARLRSALVICGVAVGALLMLVLVATYRSVAVGVAEYVGRPQIDLWVAPRGTNNLIRSSAVMPAALADEIAQRADVREAAPLLRGFVTAENAKTGRGPWTLLAMGYSTPRGLGGPTRIVRGRGVRRPGEVVLDRAAAHRLAAAPGDVITLNGQDLRVVGVSAGTNLMATQFAFVDATDAERLSGISAGASFVAVGLRAGARANDVARQIRRRHPDVDVFSRDAFVDNNVAEVGAGFRPMQILVSAVGLTAAAMLVALLVQATVDDRKRDIAVLFAIGASSRTVARGLVTRTLTLAVAGTAVGAAGARVLGAALDAWVPTVEMTMRATDVLAAALMVGAAAVAACAPALWRLRRIDPVEAFRP